MIKLKFSKNFHKINFVEYLEMEDYFQIKGEGKYKWVRIFTPAKDIDDKDYYNNGYAFIADNYLYGHRRVDHESIVRGTIDNTEYKRLKKIARKKYQFKVINTQYINIAWLTLLILFLANMDKIVINFKHIYHLITP